MRFMPVTGPTVNAANFSPAIHQSCIFTTYGQRGSTPTLGSLFLILCYFATAAILGCMRQATSLTNTYIRKALKL